MKAGPNCVLRDTCCVLRSRCLCDVKQRSVRGWYSRAVSVGVVDFCEKRCGPKRCPLAVSAQAALRSPSEEAEGTRGMRCQQKSHRRVRLSVLPCGDPHLCRSHLSKKPSEINQLRSTQREIAEKPAQLRRLSFGALGAAVAQMPNAMQIRNNAVWNALLTLNYDLNERVESDYRM